MTTTTAASALPGGATDAAARSAMTADRKTALAGGVLYLLTFSSIPRLVLYGPLLNDPAFVLGAGPDTGVLWGAFLEILVSIAIVGTGTILFPVVRRQHEGIALSFAAARIIEAGIILVGVLSLLAVVTLRQADGDPGSLVTAQRGLVGIQTWAFLLGQGLIPGINALLLGSLIYKGRLVPRIIPALGLIGGPLMISSVLGQLVGVNTQYSPWSLIALVPIFAWELSLGLWLTFKGFRSTSPLIEQRWVDQSSTGALGGRASVATEAGASSPVGS